MNTKQIDRFFKIFSRELGEEAQVILTGAAAGAYWGRIRPSFDVDFEVTLRHKNPALWTRVEQAAAVASQETGIQANFADDIDRWGMISLLDYRKHRVRYRHFGPLKLELMDPVYWSIGKITRFLKSDIEDVVDVFHRRRISWKKAVEVWGKALKKVLAQQPFTYLSGKFNISFGITESAVGEKAFSVEEALASFDRWAQ